MFTVAWRFNNVENIVIKFLILFPVGTSQNIALLWQRNETIEPIVAWNNVKQ